MKRNRIPRSEALPLYADVIVEPKNPRSPLMAYCHKTGWIEKVRRVETIDRDLVRGCLAVAAVTFEHFVHFDTDEICSGAWFVASDLVVAPEHLQEY